MTTPAPRSRRSTDLPGCVALLRQVHRTDHYPAAWPADPIAWLTSGTQLAAWVVHDGTAPLGHAVLTDGEPEISELTGHAELPPGRPFAGVARLFSAPHHRRSGVGRALLDLARATAEQLDRTLLLSVVELGPTDAVAVYRHLGWQEVAVIPADWTLPDGTRPRLRYYLAPGVTAV